MPVLTVHALAPADGEAVPRMLSELVAAVAAAMSAPVAGTWAHFLPVAAVQQGRRAMGFDGHCPVVVVRGRARDDTVVGAVLTAAATAVADGLGVPVEDVWVQWVDVGPGRVFAGGSLLT